MMRYKFSLGFALVLAMLAVPALAQQQQYTVTLTPPQLNLIWRALAKQPYEDVAQTVTALQQQISAQDQAAAAIKDKQAADQKAQEKAAADKQRKDLEDEIARVRAENERLKTPPPHTEQNGGDPR